MLTFDVYTHSDKGQIGISRNDGCISIATIMTDGRCSVESKPMSALAGTIARINRSKYKKIGTPLFLRVAMNAQGIQLGEFVKKHPDFSDEVLGGVVIFVNKPHQITEDVFMDWQTQIEKLSPSWSTGLRWVEKQQRSQDFLVAFDTHPAMTLILAQWGCENKLTLLSELENMPKQSPKDNPLAWVEFLQRKFTEKQVHHCAADLGMSFRDLMCNKPDGESPQQTSSSDDWLEQFASAIF